MKDSDPLLRVQQQDCGEKDGKKAKRATLEQLQQLQSRVNTTLFGSAYWASGHEQTLS